jgi:hypothetical protein
MPKQNQNAWPVDVPPLDRMLANATRVCAWPWWSPDGRETTCLRKLDQDIRDIRATEKPKVKFTPQPVPFIG